MPSSLLLAQCSLPFRLVSGFLVALGSSFASIESGAPLVERLETGNDVTCLPLHSPLSAQLERVQTRPLTESRFPPLNWNLLLVRHSFDLQRRSPLGHHACRMIPTARCMQSKLEKRDITGHTDHQSSHYPGRNLLSTTFGPKDNINDMYAFFLGTHILRFIIYASIHRAAYYLDSQPPHTC